MSPRSLLGGTLRWADSSRWPRIHPCGQTLSVGSKRFIGERFTIPMLVDETLLGDVKGSGAHYEAPCDEGGQLPYPQKQLVPVSLVWPRHIAGCQVNM